MRAHDDDRDTVRSATRREYRDHLRSDPPRSLRWAWVVGSVIGFGLVGMTVIGVFAFQAMQIRGDLTSAREGAIGIVDSARSGDDGAVERAARTILEQTDRASRTATGPLWGFASLLPGVGANVSAVSDAARATEILVEEALPPALDILAATDSGSLTLAGGGVNLEPFVAAQSALPQIAAAFDNAKVVLDRIELDALAAPVADAVGELSGVIDQAGPALQLAEKYLPTLLDLAGRSGGRDYLVLFQNNAEARATGGNPAASFVLHVDGGTLAMTQQASATTFDIMQVSDRVYLELPDETLALYSSEFSRASQNYNYTPNFPTTARLFEALWSETMNLEVDGVISIDPVVLSYMLQVTGPITLDTGEELSAENAVKVLLSDTYERFGNDGMAADIYFADIASRVFQRVVSGGWDPMAMLGALTQAANDQRIYLWFPTETEQSLATDLGLDGALATENAEQTEVGVFVNDASYGKLEYYLQKEVAVSCDMAAGTVRTSITLSSSAPLDGNLSSYTLGQRNAGWGIPLTSMILNVLYFAPPGAEILATEPVTGDESSWDRASVEDGRNAVSRTIVLDAGEVRTVSFESALGTGPHGPLSVRFTPGVNPTPIEVDSSCAGLASGN